jgi:hypothetical protein
MADAPGTIAPMPPAPAGRPRGRWPLSRGATVAAGVAVVVIIGGTAYAVWPDDGSEPPPPGQGFSVTPSDDTYVNAASPGKGFGDQPKLVAANEAAGAKTIYLKFTLPALPAGKVATSATLTLTRDTVRFAATTVQVHEVPADGWTQQDLTYSTAPAPGTVLGEAPAKPGGDTVEVSLGALPTGGAVAFAITSPVTGGVVRFRSTEAGGGAPRLSYRAGQGSAVALPPQPSAVPSAEGSAAPSAAPPSQDAGGSGCSVSAILVPSCGRWLGAAPQARSAVRRPDALANFEQRLGAPVDIMHTYHSGNQLFPTADEAAMAREPGRNRHLLINWKPSGKWADVAAGQSDAQIDRLAAHITSTFPGKFFLAIYHEPENNVIERAGSKMRASDYRDMYRHVVQRLREKGVTNAVTVMNYMGAVKWGIQPWFGDLYPGDDVVDWVAFDPYSVGEPGFNSGDFASMVNRGKSDRWPGMYDWVVTNHPGKPVMLAEWGFGDSSGNPSAKPGFFTGMAGELARFPALKALVYFDAQDAAPFGDTRIDSSQRALAAFKKLSGDPGIARAPVVKVP